MSECKAHVYRIMFFTYNVHYRAAYGDTGRDGWYTFQCRCCGDYQRIAKGLFWDTRPSLDMIRI